MTSKHEQLQKFLNKQKEKIEKDKWLRGIELGKDPGLEYVNDWVKRNAKRFRHNYALDDIKESLAELKEIRKGIDDYMKKIVQLTDFANDAEEKLIEALEFLESEKENGNRDSDK